MSKHSGGVDYGTIKQLVVEATQIAVSPFYDKLGQLATGLVDTRRNVVETANVIGALEESMEGRFTVLEKRRSDIETGKKKVATTNTSMQGRTDGFKKLRREMRKQEHRLAAKNALTSGFKSEVTAELRGAFLKKFFGCVAYPKPRKCKSFFVPTINGERKAKGGNPEEGKLSTVAILEFSTVADRQLFISTWLANQDKVKEDFGAEVKSRTQQGAITTAENRTLIQVVQLLKQPALGRDARGPDFGLTLKEREVHYKGSVLCKFEDEELVWKVKGWKERFSKAQKENKKGGGRDASSSS